MESLFIFFTNPYKLIALDYERDFIEKVFFDDEEPKLNKKVPFCLINRNEMKFSHDLELNEPSAFALIAFDFLIGDHDRQELEKHKVKLSQFAERYKQVYVVYHDNMERQLDTNFHLDLIQELKKKGRSKDPKKGMHRGKKSSKRDYYIVAINLATMVARKKSKEQLNKTIKEAHELIGEDVELKQNLNLLHECLTPSGAEDVKNKLDNNDSDYQEIKNEVEKVKYKDRKTENFDEDKTAINHLFDLADKGKDCFDKDYNYQLTHLSNRLLSQ